mmetsp:Transcript_16529/g.50652  ORF Transcript_16529/g.50652 Transcript_16529/m.50652 type:complete len:341 (-) Transcript_16529:1018-2040(-)
MDPAADARKGGGSGDEAGEVGKRGGGKNPNVGSFLTKCFTIFSTESYAQYCGFSEDGDSAVIYNVHEFAAKILPRHFKHSNMQSFVRQLNMYGFRKSPSEPTTAVFKHPNFKRGRADLLVLIKRRSAEERRKMQAAGASDDVAGPATMLDDVAAQKKKLREEAGAASGGKQDSEMAKMQHTLMELWSRLQGTQAATMGLTPTLAAPQVAAVAATDALPPKGTMGLFNQTGVITPGMDLTSIPKHTDAGLNELVRLRESLDRMQNRMAAMELEHRSLLSQNTALWAHLDIHQNRQAQLQSKLQRILMFMYQMHVHMGGEKSSRGNEAEAPGQVTRLAVTVG